MASKPWDVRLRRITWEPYPKTWSVRRRCRILIAIGLPCVVWYFGWLLNVPARHGTPLLYGILVVAELCNLSQVLGFWWTVAHECVRPSRAPTKHVAEDVLNPTCNDTTHIVDIINV